MLKLLTRKCRCCVAVDGDMGGRGGLKRGDNEFSWVRRAAGACGSACGAVSQSLGPLAPGKQWTRVIGYPGGQT